MNLLPNNESNGGLGDLHPREIALLKKIRELYRYGTIEIETKDGLPNYVLRTVVREKIE